MLIFVNINQIRSIEILDDQDETTICVTFSDRTGETYTGDDARFFLKAVKNYFMPIVN